MNTAFHCFEEVNITTVKAVSTHHLESQGQPTAIFGKISVRKTI